MSDNTWIDFLIVDDDEIFVSMMVRALSKRQFSCLSALNVRAAEQLVSHHRFRYALLDLKIGTDSGLTLIDSVKEKQPEINIVILTGYSSIATAVETIKRGGNNYLCKPADIPTILNAFQLTDNSAEKTQEESPHSVARLEWEHIQRVLAEHEGNVSATARALNMHRRTLQRKLQKRPVKH